MTHDDCNDGDCAYACSDHDGDGNRIYGRRNVVDDDDGNDDQINAKIR